MTSTDHGLAERVRHGDVEAVELVDEATLPRIAGRLERAKRWAERRPTILKP